MDAQRLLERQRREEEQRARGDQVQKGTMRRSTRSSSGPSTSTTRAPTMARYVVETRKLNPHKRLIGDIQFVPDLPYWGGRENGVREIVRLATLPAIIAIIRDVDGDKIGLSQVWLDPVEPRKWKPTGSPRQQRAENQGREKAAA